MIFAQIEYGRPGCEAHNGQAYVFLLLVVECRYKATPAWTYQASKRNPFVSEAFLNIGRYVRTTTSVSTTTCSHRRW